MAFQYDLRSGQFVHTGTTDDSLIAQLALKLVSRMMTIDDQKRTFPNFQA